MEALMLVGIIICFLVFLDWFWTPKYGLPSPRRIPLIGNMLSLRQDVHKQWASWGKQFGDMYCFSALNKDFVVVCDFESIYEVLVTKGKEFGGRLTGYRSDLVFHKSQDIFSQGIGPKWKKLRFITHQSLKQHGEGLGRIEDMATNVAQLLVNDIHRKSVNGVIDPYDAIYMAVTNSISCFIVGHQLPVDHPIYRKFIQMERILVQKLTVEDGIELDIMPWLRFFGNSTYKELCLFNELKREVYDDIKEILGDLESPSEFGLAPALIHELNTNEKGIGPYLDEGIIQAVISDIIAAGISTSSNSFYALLLVLSSHPEVQQRMYEEIVACLKAKSSHKGPVTFNDRQSMPYTRACLFELLRYTSIVTAMIHTSAEDTDILGHKIPKDTQVLACVWSMLHDDKYWDSPWEFNPDRFLDEDGDVVASDHPNRKRLLSFGAGPRVCLGQTFAMTRLFIVTTAVLQEFEIRPVPGTEVQYDPRCYKFGVVLKPPHQQLWFKSRK